MQGYHARRSSDNFSSCKHYAAKTHLISMWQFHIWIHDQVMKFCNDVAELSQKFTAPVFTFLLGETEFSSVHLLKNKIIVVEDIHTPVNSVAIFHCNLKRFQVTERRPGDHAQRTIKRFSKMIRKSTFAATIAKLFGTAAVAATLCMSSSAQAGVLDFEGYADNFVFDGAGMTVGKYYIETAGGGFALIGNNDSCSSDIACPRNNATTYYMSADDSYTFIQMDDGSAFKLASLDASFLGFAGQSYPTVAGLLQVAAFNAANALVGQIQLSLAGPVGGNFNFATYDLTALGGGLDYSYIRLASFACVVGSVNCNRTTNQAQFALDNVVTYVPEPGSFALMGLGLFGIGAAARRRKTAAAAI